MGQKADPRYAASERRCTAASLFICSRNQCPPFAFTEGGFFGGCFNGSAASAPLSAVSRASTLDILGQTLQRLGDLNGAELAMGRFFHEEIAEPLGIDFFIGLPAAIPESRIAMIKEFGLWGIVSGMVTMPFRASLGFFSPKSVVKRAFATPIPKTHDPAQKKREYMTVEGPAYNGVGSARGIAKAYSVFATGAKELSLKRESLEALTNPAPQPSGGAADLITGLVMPFSLGFCKPFRGYDFGSSEKAFGMPGLGGSFGYADPDTGSSFAYIPNRWQFRLYDDLRQVALWKAFKRCIAKLG